MTVLIVVLAVMAGFEREVKSRLLGFAPHIELEKMEGGEKQLIYTWREVKAILSRLDPAEGGAHLTANMLAASYARNEIQSGADAEQVVDGWTQTEARLAGAA